MDDKGGNRELLNRAVVLINRLIAIARTPKDFGTGVLLYPSEIHTIEAIGKTPGINVTELAAALGISKPAVSKFVKKLERKKLVSRYKEKGNDREVFFRLLSKGREIFEGHRDYHMRADAVILRKMKNMSDAEIQSIGKLLDMIELYADKVPPDGRF